MAVAESLAEWAHSYVPDAEDLALAQRSLLDTLAVTLAAREHEMPTIAAGLPEAARWAAIGHVLDFDDLHIESTTHISVVVVPAVLAARGDARAYLAGAGVMARLGMLLGWPHYQAGWHATCTAGAPAAAVAAGIALDLSPRQLATAMALAVPGAGGVQAAFGTHSKSLQVGFAAEAGMRAAQLVRRGATADPSAVDAWMDLVGGHAGAIVDRPAVPGGLAVKVFPCCYALQRPIAAVREIRDQVEGERERQRAGGRGSFSDVTRVRVCTPEATMQPLIHDRPRTGLEGKFSLPYAIACALLDDYPGFASFTDAAVNRTQAQRLLATVEVERTQGGAGLLDGEVDIRVDLASGTSLHTRLAHPPGSPRRTPSAAELDGKLAACGPDVPALLAGVTWESAPELLA